LKLSPKPFSHDRFRDGKFTFEDFTGVFTHGTRAEAERSRAWGVCGEVCTGSPKLAWLGQLISDMLADGEAVAGDGDTLVTAHVTFLRILQSFPNVRAQIVDSGISKVHRKSAYRPFGTRTVDENAARGGQRASPALTTPSSRRLGTPIGPARSGPSTYSCFSSPTTRPRRRSATAR
jgi:hypothetical protein